MYLPSSTAFFQGQTDAASGRAMPRPPSSHTSYDEAMYFRGFVQQLRKMTKVYDVKGYNSGVFALAS